MLRPNFRLSANTSPFYSYLIINLCIDLQKAVGVPIKNPSTVSYLNNPPSIQLELWDSLSTKKKKEFLTCFWLGYD